MQANLPAKAELKKMKGKMPFEVKGEVKEQNKIIKGTAFVTKAQTKRRRVIYEIDLCYYKTEDGYKLFDVRIDGASTILDFRNQFSSIIKKKGVNHLLDLLEKKFLLLVLVPSTLFTSHSLIAVEQVDFNSAASIFLNKNASVLKSRAAILSYQALQAKADSLSEPKFTMISYVGPIFKAEGDALSVTRDYSKWGPIIGADAEILWQRYILSAILKDLKKRLSAREWRERLLPNQK